MLTNTKINIDKIYICHHPQLIDRKKYIQSHFLDCNITEYEFVELFCPEDIKNDQINLKYPLINYSSLTLGEKSLALKHAWIIEDAFNKQYESILIFEDDVQLCKNFVELFNLYKNKLPNDWDLGWVGTCCGLTVTTNSTQHVYKTSRGSRCTHAFCLSKKFINQSHKEFKNINQPSDFYYNYVINKLNCNNYWFEPALATQSKEFYSSLKENFKW
jgi:GR25 family glycosyltransferase involved in LPS biosynthesis